MVLGTGCGEKKLSSLLLLSEFMTISFLCGYVVKMRKHVKWSTYSVLGQVCRYSSIIMRSDHVNKNMKKGLLAITLLVANPPNSRSSRRRVLRFSACRTVLARGLPSRLSVEAIFIYDFSDRRRCVGGVSQDAIS